VRSHSEVHFSHSFVAVGYTTASFQSESSLSESVCLSLLLGLAQVRRTHVDNNGKKQVFSCERSLFLTHITCLSSFLTFQIVRVHHWAGPISSVWSEKMHFLQNILEERNSYSTELKSESISLFQVRFWLFANTKQTLNLKWSKKTRRI
jgi:hypothetical protein